MSWQVYVLHCKDESLYTGITVDVERRLEEHNFNNQKAARYTRSRRPVLLLHVQACDSRSAASKLESRLKKMTRKQKIAWLQEQGVRSACFA